MKITTSILTMLFLSCSLVLTAAEVPESLKISAPAALPRGCTLQGFSPLLRIQYADLKPEAYTLKIWLLEEQNYYVASTQWSEQAIPIDNTKHGVPNGQLSFTANMDVYDYPSFLWVARLFNSAGLEVASTKAHSISATVRPVLLKPVGRRVGTPDQPLNIQLEFEPSKDAVPIFRMQDAPAGATLDSKTGKFSWTPTSAGVVNVIFEVVTGDSKVADAEIVTIDVSNPGEVVSK